MELSSCDCGDYSLWKTSCSLHGGLRPQESLPSHITESIREIVATGFQFVVGADSTANAGVVRLMKWIKSLLSLGDIWVHAFAEAMVNHCPLERLLRRMIEFPEDAVESIVSLFRGLLCETIFRRYVSALMFTVIPNLFSLMRQGIIIKCFLTFSLTAIIDHSEENARSVGIDLADFVVSELSNCLTAFKKTIENGDKPPLQHDMVRYFLEKLSVMLDFSSTQKVLDNIGQIGAKFWNFAVERCDVKVSNAYYALSLDILRCIERGFRNTSKLNSKTVLESLRALVNKGDADFVLETPIHTFCLLELCLWIVIRSDPENMMASLSDLNELSVFAVWNVQAIHALCGFVSLGLLNSLNVALYAFCKAMSESNRSLRCFLLGFQQIMMGFTKDKSQFIRRLEVAYGIDMRHDPKSFVLRRFAFLYNIVLLVTSRDLLPGHEKELMRNAIIGRLVRGPALECDLYKYLPLEKRDNEMIQDILLEVALGGKVSGGISYRLKDVELWNPIAPLVRLSDVMTTYNSYVKKKGHCVLPMKPWKEEVYGMDLKSLLITEEFLECERSVLMDWVSDTPHKSDETMHLVLGILTLSSQIFPGFGELIGSGNSIIELVKQCGKAGLDCLSHMHICSGAEGVNDHELSRERAKKGQNSDATRL
jgi:hypothetical protein